MSVFDAQLGYLLFATLFAKFSSHHHAVTKFELCVAYMHSSCTYKLSQDLYPLPSSIRSLDDTKKKITGND